MPHLRSTNGNIVTQLWLGYYQIIKLKYSDLFTFQKMKHNLFSLYLGCYHTIEMQYSWQLRA